MGRKDDHDDLFWNIYRYIQTIHAMEDAEPTWRNAQFQFPV